jgi:hypothetical protein
MRTDLTSCSNEHHVTFSKARDVVARVAGLTSANPNMENPLPPLEAAASSTWHG